MAPNPSAAGERTPLLEGTSTRVPTAGSTGSTGSSTACSTGPEAAGDHPHPHPHKRGSVSLSARAAPSKPTTNPESVPEQAVARSRAADDERKGSGWIEDYLEETLQQPHTTTFLLTITFSTAVLDSMTYNRFETFASNQTGNMVFLALAAMHSGQRKLKLTATSSVGFILSGLICGQLGAHFGHRRRAWVLSSLFFQIVILALFTHLALPTRFPEFAPHGRWEWVLMLLAAVQSGPQVTMGTNIDNLMPTAMLTSPIAGLLSDPDLFTLRRAPRRDKRLVYILTFIVGAHVGLASDMFLSQWTTAILALIVKTIAFVMATRIPGSPTA